jgi:hypothetical protein
MDDRALRARPQSLRALGVTAAWRSSPFSRWALLPVAPRTEPPASLASGRSARGCATSRSTRRRSAVGRRFACCCLSATGRAAPALARAVAATRLLRQLPELDPLHRSGGAPRGAPPAGGHAEGRTGRLLLRLVQRPPQWGAAVGDVPPDRAPPAARARLARREEPRSGRRVDGRAWGDGVRGTPTPACSGRPPPTAGCSTPATWAPPSRLRRSFRTCCARSARIRPPCGATAPAGRRLGGPQPLRPGVKAPRGGPVRFRGDGQPGPLDGPTTTAQAWQLERALLPQSIAFVDRLRRLDIPVHFDAYGRGTHAWPYWDASCGGRCPPAGRSAATGGDEAGPRITARGTAGPERNNR